MGPARRSLRRVDRLAGDCAAREGEVPRRAMEPHVPSLDDARETVRALTAEDRVRAGSNPREIYL